MTVAPRPAAVLEVGAGGLTGTALWHNNAIPHWPTLLFCLGLIVAAASRPGITAVPMQLPFAVAMTLLSMRVIAGDRSQGPGPRAPVWAKS